MEKQMEMDKAQFAEQLKNLVELGKKKKNVLEYQEINDFFKGITLNNEQMDLIFEYLEANGVDVLRVTEDDALLDNEDMHMEEDEVDLEKYRPFRTGRGQYRGSGSYVSERNR